MIAPHDPEAEAALLGGMLLGKGPVQAALGTLVASDFYVPNHQRVFAAFESLHAKGHPIEILGTVRELRRTGDLEAIGSPSFLHDLEAACGSTTAAPRYVAVIAHAAALRALAATGERITALAREDHEDAADAIDRAQEWITDIRLPVTATPAGLSSIDDFLDRPANLQAPWVVPGLLRSDWRVVIVAPEGVGKSVLFRQFAMMSAQGTHPLTRQPMRKAITLLVDLENPEEAIRGSAAPLRVLSERSGVYERHRTFIWHQPGGINLRTRRHRAELEAVIQHVRPELVCLGPLYKAFRRKAGEDHEQAVEEVQQVFDDLRTRHRFGLLLEHHAPKKQAGVRDIEPFGSQRWLAWPEIGIGLLPEDSSNRSLIVKKWRGDRLPNGWPDALNRGGPGNPPWVGNWSEGMPSYEGAA